MLLQGKSAIVTGASSGIGEALAEGFAAAGARLVLADINEAAGRAVTARLVAGGAQAVFLPVNIVKEDQCAAMVALAEETYGGLDCAVNCAGLAHAPTPLHEIEEAVWRHVWEVDTLGTAFCLKHEIPALRRRGSGSIVNIASGAGTHGAVNMGAYVAAKHAVVGLTRNAALENAPHEIRVNAVCPGLILTETANQVLPPGMSWEDLVTNPSNRNGAPSEVANLCVWLASDMSTFITGETIAIDGGKYLG